MRNHIGEIAGKIWEMLGHKKEVNVSALSKMIKEKSDITYQGLGWLARENKLVFHKKGARSFVALTPSEQKVFEAVR